MPQQAYGLFLLSTVLPRKSVFWKVQGIPNIRECRGLLVSGAVGFDQLLLTRHGIPYSKAPIRLRWNAMLEQFMNFMRPSFC